MKKLFVIFLLLIFCSCEDQSDLEQTAAQSGVADKETGDGLTAEEFTAVKNTADTADALATVNASDIDDLEDGTGIDADAITDSHIDFGTSSGQVSGADIPLDTTNFDDILDSNDDDLLTALETLDEGRVLDDLSEATPSSADWVMWEDESTGVKSKVAVTDLPTGASGLDAGVDEDTASDSVITIDTDDDWMRAYDSDNLHQWIVGMKNVTLQFTVATPNSYADSLRDFFPIWVNRTGAIFNIDAIYCQSDTDDTALDLESYPGDDDWTASSIESMNITTNGTNVYYTSDSSISGDATIANGEGVAVDFNDADTPGVVQCQIKGWFNADVP